MTWYVVRSATRQEKRAAASLREAGYTVYMPARTVMTSHARKVEPVDRPLFVGYMFLLDPGEKGFYAIRDADGVNGLINVNGRPATVAHSIVTQFFLAQLAGLFDETRFLPPPAWKPKKGDVGKIQGGPYHGIVGEVLRLESKSRVRLLYELFGRKGEVTLPVAQLVAA